MIKPIIVTFLTIMMLNSVCSISSQADNIIPNILKIGSEAPDFSLLRVDGKIYSPKDFERAAALAIIFSCNHCPAAQAYEDSIIPISDDCRSKGIAIIVISPNSEKALNYSELSYSDMGNSYEEMKIHFSDKGFTYPDIDNVYEMIVALDHEWQGALQYTMLTEPGGKIIYNKQDVIVPLAIKKLIFDNGYTGRYY